MIYLKFNIYDVHAIWLWYEYTHKNKKIQKNRVSFVFEQNNLQLTKPGREIQLDIQDK